MKKTVTTLCAVLFLITGLQAQVINNSQLQKKYGLEYREILQKAQGDQAFLKQAEEEYNRIKRYEENIVWNRNSIMLKSAVNTPYVGRSEAEPNNFFNEADNIDDVLTTEGVLNNGEYQGKLVTGEFNAPDDVDVYEFTVDTTMMYYFGGLHGTTNAGEAMGVHMRLFHETDLDTNTVEDFKGIPGNDQIKGDILGNDTDGRGGAGLFRLTGWSSPINPETGEKLTGKFYLWIFNGEGQTGTYNFTAYQIQRSDWVDIAEPNYPYSNLLANTANPDVYLSTDGVVRSYMLYAPDTVKYQHSEDQLPTQSNGAFDNLLAEGDEDIDLYFVEYKADHTLVIETIPYFGYYRENDGTPRAGSARLSDPRIRVYDGGFTNILFEDDDGAREQHDGPNNIHSRVVMSSEALAEKGVTSTGPLVFWMGAWASKTRDPNQSVNSSDPGRMMYKVYAYQYHNDPVEFEPNDTPENATVIAARADTVVNGSFENGSDVDMYRVFLHEVRMYTLFSANSSTSSDINIKIYHESASGPDNNVSRSGDLVAEQSLNVMRNGNDFQLNGFVPEESGAYIIEASSASAGDYQLGVVDKGEIFFGRISNEPDNSLADALEQDPLQVGAGAPSITSMIYPAGDTDIYRFNTSEEVTITVRPSNQDLVDDFDAELTILDGSGTELASSASGAISFNPSEAGEFFVQVASANEGRTGFYVISGGEPFEEQEPNNTAAQATELAIGELYEAELGANDTDYFKVRLKAGSLYSFRSVDQETGTDLSVEFLDSPDGETLLDESGWVNNYSGNFKIANIMPEETRDYYIKVEGAAGPYKILSRENPEFYALRDKHEPNNTIAEADQLGAVKADGVDRMYVQFAPDSARFFGDLDYFRVDLLAGQQLVAETKPVGGISSSSAAPNLWNQDTDTRIRLFDAEGNELASDDDGGNAWYSKIETTIPEDGSYYVQVANSRGAGGGDDRSMRRGDYYLNISASFTENESNNTFAEADENPLGDNSYVEAQFVDENDTDIFKLELQEGRIYHLRSVKTSEGSDALGVQLFRAGDTSTNLLDTEASFNTRYGGDNFKINFIPDATEEYYLRLTPPEGAAEFGYQVYMKSNGIEGIGDEFEPNNSIEEAAALGDHPADGKFHDYMLYDANIEGFHDDLDYYQVTAAAGDTITAETAPFDGAELWSRDFDAYMYLYDSEGNELASNDDGGVDWHSKITYEVTESGTYYFLVVGQDAHIAPRNDTADRIRDPARGEYKLSVYNSSNVIGTSTEEELAEVKTFELSQNYPNPFNPTTNIRYSIDVNANVKLEVFNVLGQKVATLVNAKQAVGSYTVGFDAGNLSSGMYFYRLQAAGKVQINKMMLIK